MAGVCSGADWRDRNGNAGPLQLMAQRQSTGRGAAPSPPASADQAFARGQRE